MIQWKRNCIGGLIIAGIAGCGSIPDISVSVAEAQSATDGAIILSGRNLLPSTTYNVDVSKREGSPRKIGSVQSDSEGNITNARLEYHCISGKDVLIEVALYLPHTGEGGATADTSQKTCY